MNDTEISRLAHAINELRPEWPISSLTTWIRNNLANRPFRDAAVALTWVATDRKGDGSYASEKPARVLEAGPWWRAVNAGEEGVTATAHPNRDTACPVCGRFFGTCRCTPEEIAAQRRPGVRPPPQVREVAGFRPKVREVGS